MLYEVSCNFTRIPRPYNIISSYTNFQKWNGLYHCQNGIDLSYEWEYVYNLQNTTHTPIKNDKWKEK